MPKLILVVALSPENAMHHLRLDSPAATEALGRLFGRLARANDLICLDGDLGTGKTTLTQAIARGLGIAAEHVVCSPSFAVLHEYPGRLPLYHMDFYRLGGSGEVEAMGLEEYFTAGGLTVVEWAERAREILPEERVEVRLRSLGESAREATIVGSVGWADRLAEVAAAFARPDGTEIFGSD